MKFSKAFIWSLIGVCIVISPVISQARTVAPNTCYQCAELKAIIAETKSETRKKKFDIDALQLRASAVIHSMATKSKIVTPEQIAVIVDAFAASVPHDPAAAIIENNIEIITANRAAFDAQIAKLPKAQATELKETIAIALSTDTEGTDPAQ